MPGATGGLMALANRLLPGPDGRADRAPVEGVASESSASPSVLTSLGDRAAALNNQIESGQIESGPRAGGEIRTGR
jgi:hypothetical protein